MNKKLRAYTEKWYPIAFGLMALGLYYLQLRGTFVPPEGKTIQFFLLIINYCVVSLCFLMSTRNMVLNYSDNYIFQQIHKYGLYSRFIRFYYVGVQSIWVSIAVSFFCLYLDFNTNVWAINLVWPFWLFCIVVSTFNLVRFTILGWKVISKS